MTKKPSAAVTAGVATFGYEAAIMPGVAFPTTTAWFKLQQGGSLVISPGPVGPLSEPLAGEEPLHVATLNIAHHLHLVAFLDRFPHATVYGPGPIADKQPKIADRLKSLDQLAAALGDEVELIPVGGNEFLEETAFFHRPTGTLVLQDLIFNMRQPMPLGRRILLTLVGAYNKVGQSALVKFTTKDRGAYKKAIEAITALPCQRIIPGHGSVIESDEISEAWRELRASAGLA